MSTARDRSSTRPESLLVPAAHTLPSNAAYLAHLDAGAGEPPLIRLGSNENSEPPSPRVREALERSYDDANRSPSTRPPLRLELAARFGVSPERILLGAGSTELIDATMRTFVRAGDEVILPRPSWPVFRRRLAALQANTVEVPLAAGPHAYDYDLDALLGAVTDRTKLIVLCSPNNPTGNSLALDAVRRCAQAGPALLLDAAYADFDPDVDLSPLVHEYRNVVLTRTFSKAYCLAGLRVGYVVGDANVLDYVDRFLVPGSSVSSASLHAGLAALEDEEYRRRQVARILAERERLLGRLRDLGVTAYESRGNFVAFDAAAHPGQAVGLVGEVRARGVVIRAMDEAIVRVSVGTPTENDAAVAAIAAVRSAAAPT
ncbi:MAG TPA: histidinol-phosphate transaminase [Gaiellaceae bacterium]|nr:histidinol-phosphate transaminase [Gaiellaceae bacterium]